jgi:hypothetical protein
MRRKQTIAVLLTGIMLVAATGGSIGVEYQTNSQTDEIVLAEVTEFDEGLSSATDSEQEYIFCPENPLKDVSGTLAVLLPEDVQEIIPECSERYGAEASANVLLSENRGEVVASSNFREFTFLERIPLVGEYLEENPLVEDLDIGVVFGLVGASGETSFENTWTASETGEVSVKSEYTYTGEITQVRKGFPGTASLVGATSEFVVYDRTDGEVVAVASEDVDTEYRRLTPDLGTFSVESVFALLNAAAGNLFEEVFLGELQERTQGELRDEANVRGQAIDNPPRTLIVEFTTEEGHTYELRQTTTVGAISTKVALGDVESAISATTTVDRFVVRGTEQPAPTASVSIADQQSDGTTVTVDSVSLSEGGFVAIHEGSAGGAVVGTSSYLSSGDHEDVVVTLDEPLTANGTVVAMPHRDTDGDQSFTFVESGGSTDGPYTDGGAPVTDAAAVAIPPAPASFAVSNLQAAASVTQGESVAVEATVENVGEATSTRLVEFRIDADGDGTPEAVGVNETLTLAGGENATVTFTVPTDGLAPGSYAHGVFSPDDAATATLDVAAPPTPANFTVSDLSAPASVTQGETVTVTATVTNTGETDGTQLVAFRFDTDGDGIPDALGLNESVSLAAGASQQVSFSVPTDDVAPGTYAHGVFSADDGETASLTVEAADGGDGSDGGDGGDGGDGSTSEPTFYQVDLVVGEPLQQLSADTLYATQDRLIRFAHGNTDDGLTEQGRAWASDEIRSCVVDSTVVDRDGDTATVSLTLDEGCELTVSFVVYEKPGPGFSPETADQQVLFAATTEVLGPGQHTLTVELPTGTTASESEAAASA